MKRNLILTTPHMRGQRVKDCQYLLRKRGYNVRIDGDFGSVTANACAKAKWDIGFPERDCTQTFGPVLYGFLTETRPVPLTFKARAKARRLRAIRNAKNSGARVTAVLHLAFSQLGVTEWPTGSNHVKYDAWYGFVGPWCAAFVSWCCAHTAHPVHFRYSYCPAVVDDARAGRNGLTTVSGPATDMNHLVLALYDWPGESPGEADHVGFTVPESYLRAEFPLLLTRSRASYGFLGAGDFWAVEGNTSIGNQSNGGAVMLRKRNRRDVQAFVRVHV